MQNPLASFRRSALTLALLLAFAPPILADNSTPPQQQAADKDDKGGKKKGPASDLRGLPNVDTGRTAVDAGLTTSGSNRTDRSDVLTGGAINGSAAAMRETANGALNESATQRPGFNQGFDSVDKAEMEKKGEEFKRNHGNPLTAVTGGRRNDGAGPTGIAAQGTGAISDGSDGKSGTGGAILENGLRAITGNDPKGGKAGSNPFASSGDANITKGIQGDKNMRQEMMNQALCEPDCAAPAAPATPAAAPETPLNTTANPNFKLFPSGASSEKSKDGKTVTHTSADGKTVTKVTTADNGTKTVEKTTTADDGTKTTTTTTDAPSTSCQGIDGCNDAAARADFLRNNPGIAAQVNQARNGAADANVTPNREGNVAVDRSVAVPSTSQVGRNLFGQPGQVVETSGGARTGVDFNGDAGAINPGPDAVVAGSGRQDDPGNFFNQQPGPQGGAVQAPTSPGSKDCEEKKPATKRLTSVGTSKPAKKDDCAK